VLTSCNGFVYSIGAALLDPGTERIVMYYGAADTVTGLAFGFAGEIIDFIKKNAIDKS
jgi:beta-1,4-mannooligosaccharide/beta-1,4-mannosyl-N-acetylglucosamine phosphorylase